MKRLSLLFLGSLITECGGTMQTPLLTYGSAQVVESTSESIILTSPLLSSLHDEFTQERLQAFHDLVCLANKLMEGYDYSFMIYDSCNVQVALHKGNASCKRLLPKLCVFCDIMQGTSPGKILYSNTYAIALKKPYITRSFLVIPKYHVVNLKDISSDSRQWLPVWKSLLSLASVGTGGKPFRLVVNNGGGSAQTQFHLHMHVTPLCYQVYR